MKTYTSNNYSPSNEPKWRGTWIPITCHYLVGRKKNHCITHTWDVYLCGRSVCITVILQLFCRKGTPLRVSKECNGSFHDGLLRHVWFSCLPYACTCPSGDSMAARSRAFHLSLWSWKARTVHVNCDDIYRGSQHCWLPGMYRAWEAAPETPQTRGSAQVAEHISGRWRYWTDVLWSKPKRQSSHRDSVRRFPRQPASISLHCHLLRVCFQTLSMDVGPTDTHGKMRVPTRAPSLPQKQALYSEFGEPLFHMSICRRNIFPWPKKKIFPFCCCCFFFFFFSFFFNYYSLLCILDALWFLFKYSPNLMVISEAAVFLFSLLS